MKSNNFFLFFFMVSIHYLYYYNPTARNICQGFLCGQDEEFDAYIIVSFVNATLVLSIGETVEEVTDSGFLGTTPTLSCAQVQAVSLKTAVKATRQK